MQTLGQMLYAASMRDEKQKPVKPSQAEIAKRDAEARSLKLASLKAVVEKATKDFETAILAQQDQFSITSKVPRTSNLEQLLERDHVPLDILIQSAPASADFLWGNLSDYRYLITGRVFWWSTALPSRIPNALPAR